jgi:hypothetical protein
LRGAAAPRSRRALSCFNQEQFRREPDEEQVGLRVYSSEDASAESETVFLDVHVARSAFVEDSDAVVESISDAFEAEVAISGRARAGTSRRTRLPFPRHHESAIPDPKDSGLE